LELLHNWRGNRRFLSSIEKIAILSRACSHLAPVKTREIFLLSWPCVGFLGMKRTAWSFIIQESNSIHIHWIAKAHSKKIWIFYEILNSDLKTANVVQNQSFHIFETQANLRKEKDLHSILSFWRKFIALSELIFLSVEIFLKNFLQGKKKIYSQDTSNKKVSFNETNPYSIFNSKQAKTKTPEQPNKTSLNLKLF